MPQPASASRRPEIGDDQLAIAHAIPGASGELVGILLVVRNLAYVSRMQSTIAYSRKLVALGRLTAGIAHEVKNPLGGLRGAAQLLERQLPDAEQKAYTRVIIEEADRLGVERRVREPGRLGQVLPEQRFGHL